MNKKFFFSFRFLIWLAPVFILGYIFYLQINPLGLPKKYVKLPGKKHKIVSDLEPKERVSAPYKNSQGAIEQELNGNLVYFSVSNLKKSQAVMIKVFFDTNLEEVNFGIIRSIQKEADFEVRPIFNKFLENLDWYIIQEQGTALYQCEKKFDNITQFLGERKPINQTRSIYYQNKDENFLPLVNNDLEGVDYILTHYQKVENKEKEEFLFSQKFEVDKYYLDDDALRFAFLLPQIQQGYFKVKRIEVIVEEPASALLKKMKSFLD